MPKPRMPKVTGERRTVQSKPVQWDNDPKTKRRRPVYARGKDLTFGSRSTDPGSR